MGLYTKTNLLQMEDCDRDSKSIGIFILEGEEVDGCENYVIPLNLIRIIS
jgi:hypothetical protein